jgi:choline dehydrogenase-like flavoprotein
MQLSGLGPAPLLRQHGIGVIADMPGVGADLQDHYHARMAYRCTQPVSVNDLMASKRRGLMAGLRYMLTRRGLLAMGAAYAGGFFRTDAAAATPDVQCHIMLFSGDSMSGPLHPFSGISCPLIVLRPESRGHVRITSADPRRPPAIQPCYLSARKDRDVTVAGLRAPDLDLPDGRRSRRRGRRAVARAWLRSSSRDRCFDHAGARLGQHQRRHDHDRRKRRRYAHDRCKVRARARCSHGLSSAFATVDRLPA